MSTVCQCGHEQVHHGVNGPCRNVVYLAMAMGDGSDVNTTHQCPCLHFVPKDITFPKVEEKKGRGLR